MMKASFDVVVVGGGPAGAAAARAAGDEGARVLLLEKDARPREKVCGEYLCPGGVARLEELGFGPALRKAVTAPLLGMRLFSPSGREVRTEFSRGRAGLSVMRADLDPLLVEACGAVVARGARVTSLDVDSRRALVRLDDGSAVEAAVVIGADGRNSTIARRAGLRLPVEGPRRGAVHAYFGGVRDIGPWGEMHLPGDGSYVGLNPGPGGRVNMTFVCDMEKIQGLAAHRDRVPELLAGVGTLRDRFAPARMIGEPRVLSPMEVRARAGHADRVLLAGDAAGFLDPLTGEGMYFAIMTGALAGRHAARAALAGDASAAVLATYDRERRRLLGFKPWLNRGFQWLLPRRRLLGILSHRLGRSRRAANGLIDVIGNLAGARTLLRPNVLLPVLVPGA
jgi:flavin-dependent dehydrogenase